MRKAFKASRLMGLFVLALSAMAFSATAAQAEPGAHWKVNGAEYKSPLSVSVSTAIVGASGTLLTKVGLTKVEITCTTIKFIDALLQVLGGATGKIHFEGCTTKLNEKAQVNACIPHSPGAANGLIETNALDALIKLHTGGVDLLELLPVPVLVTVPEHKIETPPFAVIQFGTGECAIGNNIEIKGKAFLKDNKGEGLVEKVTHEVSEGPLSALLFGGNAATIDGSANASLAGAHAGMTFSGIAS